MYDNTGAAVNYGANSYIDFSTNNRQMQIPLALGRALIGLPPAVTCTYNHATTPAWHQTDYSGSPAAVAGLFTLSASLNNSLLYPGAPVYLTGSLPAGGAFTANKIYYLIPTPLQILSVGTTFQLADSYIHAINLTAIAAVGVDDGATITLNFLLGGIGGQGFHFPVIAELVNHAHTTTIIPSTGLGGGSDPIVGTPPGSALIYPSNAVGDNNLFNIIQPYTYMNVFFKL
jgi:hypothetical protein